MSQQSPYCRQERLTGKCLDLFADHVDTTIVTGIQLQHHLPQVFLAIYPPSERKDGRSFTGTGGTIEKEMRETLEDPLKSIIDSCAPVIHWRRQIG